MLFTKPWSRQLSLRGQSLLTKKGITTSMYVMNPFPGLDIGIPLTIFENAYTTLHYGENIVTAKSILLEFLISKFIHYNIDASFLFGIF